MDEHLDNFFQEKGFRNQDDTKDAFNEFFASRGATEFYSTTINKFVSRWHKNVLISMILFRLIKFCLIPTIMESV